MQKFDYDQETDILTIRLTEKKPDYGEQRENIITHYGKDSKPVEIEILDVVHRASSIGTRVHNFWQRLRHF
jgi:uncharacterized protein YuzE